MKLYDMKHAPNPKRVRMFLAEKGIEIERVEIDIPGGQNLAPEYLAINPRGLVPSLILDDGTVIGESIAICRYLEDLYPNPPLMGIDGKDRAIVEDWQRQMEFDGLMPVAWVFRNTIPVFKDRALPGTAGAFPQSAEMAAMGKARARTFFKTLNQRVQQTPFIAGEHFTVADITAYTALAMARWVKLEIPAELTHLHRWHTEIAARPSAKA